MKKIVFSAAVLFLLSCASQAGRVENNSWQPATCEGIEGFFLRTLNGYQDKIDVATKVYSEEEWKVETAAKDADPKKLSARFAELQAAIYDKEVLELTKAMDEATADVDAAKCPYKTRLKRARGMLESGILVDPKIIAKEKENQDAQDALVQKSNAFRMTVPGEKEPVSRAIYGKLLASTQSRDARRKLWKEHNPARAKSWLEWGFKDLIRARNEEAKLAGRANFFEYRFFRNQLDIANYRKMLEAVRTQLAPKVRREIQRMGKRVGISKVEGWDLRYLREREASGEVNKSLEKVPATVPMEVARRFYLGLEIDIDTYGFLTDLYPRAGKNTHAFAMPVVMPHVGADGAVLATPKPDIRFLANLKQPVKWEDISTVIHELGHAVHAAEVRQPIGVFRGIDSVPTEAIAMTMERMAGSVEFRLKALPQFTGVNAKKLKPILEKSARAARVEQATVLLRQMFFSDFEWRMYESPDLDPAKLWASLHKEYWGVEVSPEEADWDVEHFLMAPVYVQNYAIGILMVEQIYDSIVKEFETSFDSKELGEKLRKVYFAPGAEFDYLGLTQRFTGKELGVAAALKLID